MFRKSPELRASDALRLAALTPPAALSEQPLGEQRFVVVDLETSGLNTLKDKILSIGAVTIEHSAIALGQQFSCTLRRVNHAVSESATTALRWIVLILRSTAQRIRVLLAATEKINISAAPILRS